MTDGEVFGAIMVVPGVIAVGEGKYIIVVDAKTGATLYRYENASESFVGPATISNGVMYIGSYQGSSSGVLFAFAP